MSKEPLTEERLFEIKAREKAATPGPWVDRLRDFEGVDGYGLESHPTVEANGKTVCIFYEREIDDENDDADAAFIAAAREDVPALLAEVERLRAEVAWLKDEVASLEQELKFSDETEYDLIKKLFDLKICHREWICEQDGSSELNFEGENGCHFCWRQWAIRKARKAASEDGSHER